MLEQDPSCAIANWGIAAILIGNTFNGGATAQDAQKAKEAIQRARLTGAKTERERFYIEAIAEYWDRFGDTTYVVGDAARKDGDGYYWIIGRIDDVVNVSGHRLSTAEVESAIVSHPKVA